MEKLKKYNLSFFTKNFDTELFEIENSRSTLLNFNISGVTEVPTYKLSKGGVSVPGAGSERYCSPREELKR